MPNDAQRGDFVRKRRNGSLSTKSPALLDVRRMALPVLSHRLVLSPEARMKGQSAEKLLAALVDSIPVPGRRG